MKALINKVRLLLKRLLKELQETSKNCPNETRWVFITMMLGTFFSNVL